MKVSFLNRQTLPLTVFCPFILFIAWLLLLNNQRLHFPLSPNPSDSRLLLFPELAQSQESPPQYQLPWPSLPPHRPGRGSSLSAQKLAGLAGLHASRDCIPVTLKKRHQTKYLPYYCSVRLKCWQTTFKCFRVNSSYHLSFLLSASLKKKTNWTWKIRLVQYSRMRWQQCEAGDITNIL